MMMEENICKTYIVTDTHWYHEAMVGFCERPKNFGKIIINQWQNTIKSTDTVVHLGDVIFGDRDHLKSIMDVLPGTKILVRGNHDGNSNNWYVKAGFAFVCNQVLMADVMFSHMPCTLSSELVEKNVINVHGHFHNNHPDSWERRLKEIITKNHFLLCLEDVNYCPVSIRDIRKRKHIKNSKKIIESENR